MPKGGIKSLKGAAELELNFSARRPIKWAAYEHSYPVRAPGGNIPPVHWPPGAASTFLILPRSVTRSRHRPAVIGYRGGGSAGALLPGYGPRFVDILRRRARIVDAHVAIKNAVGT